MSAKPQIIKAIVTFHNASSGQQTCLGRRENAQMAAINRNKKHPLMGKRIKPFAYEDKNSGKVKSLKFSSRKIADCMGEEKRKLSYLRIDYYLPGPMPKEYEKYNKAVWHFKVN